MGSSHSTANSVSARVVPMSDDATLTVHALFASCRVTIARAKENAAKDALATKHRPPTRFIVPSNSETSNLALPLVVFSENVVPSFRALKIRGKSSEENVSSKYAWTIGTDARQ